MNIENRVIRLEDRLRVNKPAESLDEMMNRLYSGGYPGHSAMGLVSFLMSGGQPERLKGGNLPDVLIDHIRASLGKIQPVHLRTV